MNRENDELIIKNALNNVNTPGYDITSKIEQNMTANKSPSFKRHLVTVTAVLLLMTFTVVAAAATISGFKYLLTIIGEENAALITPVEISDEDQGIRMEVVAAGRFDNMLKVYVTFQDLIGERLGDDAKPREYNLTGIGKEKIGGMSSIGWKLMDYDEKNNKATMLFELAGSSKLEGEDLTLKINKILYNTRKVWDYKVEKNISEVERNPAVYFADVKHLLSGSLGRRYIYGFEADKIFGGLDEIPVLREQKEAIVFPQTDTFKISAIGIIDGRLHIQVWKDKNADESSYVHVSLRNAAGEYKNEDSYFSFDIEDGAVTGETDNPAYGEYVFDIDENKLGEYELRAFISESDVINGNWEIKFNSEDSGEILKTNFNMEIDSATVKSAAINPFGGIRIEGTIDDSVKIPVMFDVKINTTEGQINSSESACSYLDNKYTAFSAFYETESFIDLNSVVSLEINGRTIKLEK